MPKVWNQRDHNAPKDAVYVGRPSKWGNPYRLSGDIDVELTERLHVIKMFDENILPHLDVSELQGKDLVCWCAPLPCHADSLLKKANS